MSGRRGRKRRTESLCVCGRRASRVSWGGSIWLQPNRISSAAVVGGRPVGALNVPRSLGRMERRLVRSQTGEPLTAWQHPPPLRLCRQPAAGATAIRPERSHPQAGKSSEQQPITMPSVPSGRQAPQVTEVAVQPATTLDNITTETVCRTKIQL